MVKCCDCDELLTINENHNERYFCKWMDGTPELSAEVILVNHSKSLACAGYKPRKDQGASA